MNREQVIALLNKLGVTLAGSETDEELAVLIETHFAPDPPELAALRAERAELKKGCEEAELFRFKARLDACISDGRINEAAKLKILEAGILDAGLLLILEKLPPRDYCRAN